MGGEDFDVKVAEYLASEAVAQGGFIPTLFTDSVIGIFYFLVLNLRFVGFPDLSKDDKTMLRFRTEAERVRGSYIFWMVNLKFGSVKTNDIAKLVRTSHFICV